MIMTSISFVWIIKQCLEKDYDKNNPLKISMPLPQRLFSFLSLIGIRKLKQFVLWA